VRQREHGDRLKRQFFEYTKNQRARSLLEARYWAEQWRALAWEAIDVLRTVEAALRKK